MQLNKSGVGITFKVQSRTMGSIFKSSSSPKDCTSILPLIEALRSIKEFPAIVAPLFFDFCFLVQSVHFCYVTIAYYIKHIFWLSLRHLPGHFLSF
ncbi:hypothetical protein RHMOL_Rhmol04G0188000 [Rhododendron molle]|uniref:Uncharacterized protein n=1 Tax=Rhododendron molle TaxID=49168 RepID=A0ACC0P388_RHOML|nr:hypothetical protein RHMOL_Rhmol04G0188000 [Rhododendron molle]